ncbi:metal-sensing transcriptional repressor [Microaerobacter geothermalis]|uniref:metal-sensing transcriptional repressor n=1 Tax=Microaerobacter geothermalis TaxID=674972 RepID=UPI001F2DC73F|nr:metal-sensing transcriptional repressor [Microaerobacter geothermalis]MCF6095223.1 metal-sensing transcriptional repressor [Microaerobacter geothermalis]
MGSNHQHRKSIVNRLARIEGHVRSIKEMAKADRDCSDLLLQIAAVRKALDNVGKLILQDHLEGCVVEAIEHGNQEEVIHDLQKALNNFIR